MNHILMMTTTYSLFVTNMKDEAVSARLRASCFPNLVQDLSQRISIFVDDHTTAYVFYITSLKCIIEVVAIHDELLRSQLIRVFPEPLPTISASDFLYASGCRDWLNYKNPKFPIRTTNVFPSPAIFAISKIFCISEICVALDFIVIINIFVYRKFLMNMLNVIILLSEVHH